MITEEEEENNPKECVDCSSKITALEYRSEDTEDVKVDTLLGENLVYIIQ